MLDRARPATLRQRGFTLIEMLLVVAILVALAGLVLPRLDKYALLANKGIAANNMTGVSRYIQTFRVRHNFYPDRWDSLLDSTGKLWTLASNTSGDLRSLDPQLIGASGPSSASPNKLTTVTYDATADALYLRSIERVGITTTLSLPAILPAGTAPGFAFNTPNTIGSGNGLIFATLNGLQGAKDPDALNIIDTIYSANRVAGAVSGTIPNGKRLVVFGFGPANSAIGDVLQDCPTYPNTDPTLYYNRFLAIFELDSGGARAELKLVVAADADLLADETGDYYAE